MFSQIRSRYRLPALDRHRTTWGTMTSPLRGRRKIDWSSEAFFFCLRPVEVIKAATRLFLRGKVIQCISALDILKLVGNDVTKPRRKSCGQRKLPSKHELARQHHRAKYVENTATKKTRSYTDQKRFHKTEIVFNIFFTI